jgi:hypothetical protein
LVEAVEQFLKSRPFVGVPKDGQELGLVANRIGECLAGGQEERHREGKWSAGLFACDSVDHDRKLEDWKRNGTVREESEEGIDEQMLRIDLTEENDQVGACHWRKVRGEEAQSAFESGEESFHRG